METIKSNTGIESVIKFFSLLYVILITCGFTYSFFFFKNFGVNITEYIELSEAVSLFIPLLADSLVVMLLFIVLFYYMNKALLFGQPNNDRQAHEKKMLRKSMVTFSLIYLAVIILVIILSFFGIDMRRGLYMLITIFIALFLPLILEMIFSVFTKTWKIDLSPIFRDVLYIMMIIISIVLWTSFSKTERVYRKSGYKHFEILFNNGDSKLESDSSIYYLGRTKNYLFIYDFNKKQSRVISVSNIKEFTISK
jgi:hypothetical protein